MSRNRGNEGDRGQHNWGKGMGRTQESGELAQDMVERTRRQVENEQENSDNSGKEDGGESPRQEERSA